MSCLALPLVLALALAAPVVPEFHAQQTQTPKAKKEKKIWTNEDLEALRDKAFVSVVGQTAAAESEKAGVEPEQYVRAKDPKWYGEQLASLRAELGRADDEIRRLREFRASGRTWQGGLALGQENLSLTPENQIAQLEKRRREVQQQIDALEEQARRNDIAPGAVR